MKPEHRTFPERRASAPPTTWYSIRLAILLLLLTILSFTELSFGVLGSGLVGTAFVGALLVFGLRLVVCLRWEQLAAVKGHGFCLLALIATVPMSDPISSWRMDVAKDSAQPIIAGLDQYRGDAGRFPARLADLSPRYLDAIEEAPVGIVRRLPYSYSLGEDGTSYFLSFPAPAFMTWTFRSSERRGVIYD